MSIKLEPLAISVVMPTRNDEAYLGQALDSIIGQSVMPGEIVVVDDASDDSTPRLVAGYSERHAHLVRIRSIRLQRRSGSEHARNVAVRESRGAWIAMSGLPPPMRSPA